MVLSNFSEAVQSHFRASRYSIRRRWVILRSLLNYPRQSRTRFLPNWRAWRCNLSVGPWRAAPVRVIHGFSALFAGLALGTECRALILVQCAAHDFERPSPRPRLVRDAGGSDCS